MGRLELRLSDAGITASKPGYLRLEILRGRSQDQSEDQSGPVSGADPGADPGPDPGPDPRITLYLRYI